MSNVALRKHEGNLQKCLPKFKNVLPAHIKPETIAQSVMNALSQNRYLANADPTSVMQAAMTAAVLGLPVDNVTGQGYITPFKGKAQFIPGYKGYITLAQNSGFLVSGEVVREKDHFVYQLGLDPKLEHVPAPGGPSDRGPIQFAYATARSNNMPAIFKVIHVEYINKIRDRSEGYKAFVAGKIRSTPWETDYEPMAVKTAIRALAPQLPLNVQRAAALEGAHERGSMAYMDSSDKVEVIDVEASQVQDSGSTEEQPDLVAELQLDAPDPTYGGQYNPETGQVIDA